MDKEIMDKVKELQQIRIDIQNNQRRLEDSINDSLSNVDSLQHMLSESFDLTTAVALCKAGYFVRHMDFSSRESIHYYDAALYHENGVVVTIQDLMDDNMEDHWSVKKNPLEVDLLKLRDMHLDSQGMLLDIGSYEDCFK